MKLKGNVAIVTGSGAGIGQTTAIMFAKEGAKITCNSLSKSARETALRIERLGGEACFIRGDASKTEDAKKIISKTIEKYKKLNIVFNNAGIVIPGRVDNTSPEDWDRTLSSNVRSAYLVSKFAIPYLKETKGTIINNASSVALKGVKDRAAYAASKGAILAMTRAMAIDYIEYGIRVNCICPGTVDTPSLAVRLSKFDDPDAARAQFIARQPLGRFGTAEEIAKGVLYLVTSEFCTGTILSVDGGMTAG